MFRWNAKRAVAILIGLSSCISSAQQKPTPGEKLTFSIFPSVFNKELNDAIASNKGKEVSYVLNRVLNNIICAGKTARFKPKEQVHLFIPTPPSGMSLKDAQKIRQDFIKDSEESMHKYFFGLAMNEHFSTSAKVFKSAMNSEKIRRDFYNPYFSRVSGYSLVQTSADNPHAFDTYMIPNLLEPRTLSTGAASYADMTFIGFDYIPIRVNQDPAKVRIQMKDRDWSEYNLKNTQVVQAPGKGDNNVIVYDVSLDFGAFCAGQGHAVSDFTTK